MGLMAPNFGPRLRPDQPTFGQSFAAALQQELANYREEEMRKRQDEQREQGLVIDATQAGFRPEPQAAAALPSAVPYDRQPLPEIHPGFNRDPGKALPATLGPTGDPTMPAFGTGAPVIPHPNRNALQAAENEADLLANRDAVGSRPGVTVGGQHMVYAPEAVAAEAMVGKNNVLARQLKAIADEETRGTLTPQEAANARMEAQGLDARAINPALSRYDPATAADLAKLRADLKAQADARQQVYQMQRIHAQGEELRRTRGIPSLSKSLTPKLAPGGRGSAADPDAYLRQRYNFYAGQHDKYGTPVYEPDEAEAKARADVDLMFPGLSGGNVIRRGTGRGLPSRLGPVPNLTGSALPAALDSLRSR